MEDTLKKSALVESYLKSGDSEQIFDNPRIRKITGLVLENQIENFKKQTNLDAGDLAEGIKTRADAMKEGKDLNEATGTSSYNVSSSGDIARFGEIYLPIATKVIPSLVINNMVGVQPMSQPNGFVYGMRTFYGTGPMDSTTARRGARYDNTQILAMSNVTAATANTSYINVSGVIGSRALVLHIEGSNILVKAAPIVSTTTWVPLTAGTGVDYVDGAGVYAGVDATVSAVYANEVAQAAGMFKEFSGSVATDTGTYQQDVNQINIKVIRESVEAKTRQLFAEYPIEAEQDLRAIHKKDLRAELSEITAGNIVNEINREFIDDINTAAAVGGLTAFDLEESDGRWELEKYRNLYTRIVKAANDIAQDTRLGPGNFIVASPNVITALTQLDGFSAAPVQTGSFGSVSKIGGDWYVGRIAGMFDLYRDMFATSDYATVGRKGLNEWDAGLFFMPYIPLQFIAGQTQENLQPKLKFMSRYGKVANVLRDASASGIADPRYYRKIAVTNLFTAF